jgi:lipopolysaccharide biosynthesis regulator YciM
MNPDLHNPYVAGNPVGGSHAFVGRADVMKEVLRLLAHPSENALVLYGQRRIGKTSVLKHLAAELPSRGDVRCIYFDLQDKAMLPLPDVIRELAREIALRLDRDPPDLGDDPETAFREHWLPELLAAEPKGRAIILLLDEFDVLASPDADPGSDASASSLFPYLRELLALSPSQLNFLFVIGRNLKDLAIVALALFKGIRSKRLSLLDRESTNALVRLSEVDNELHWPDATLDAIWSLTSGHPFLTQQLCSEAWQWAIEEQSAPRTIQPDDLEALIPNVLEVSRNPLEWLWGGLPPAERVVASALAAAGPRTFTEEELERLLHESGVRVVISELQDAPRLLQDWDLLEPDGAGFRFRVELLRRWISDQKPLRRVQDELDRVQPVADSLFQAATRLYDGQDPDTAASLLEQAIGYNPNHVRANQLLADIQLARGDVDAAIELLERLFEYRPAAARPRLVQALLAKARAQVASGERLPLFERVLALQPADPEAVSGRIAIMLEDIERQEAQQRYEEALHELEVLAEQYPGRRDWQPDLDRLERKGQLAALYCQANDAMDAGDHGSAIARLVEIINIVPAYEDSALLLHKAVMRSESERREQVQATAQQAVSDGNHERAVTLFLSLLLAEPFNRLARAGLLHAWKLCDESASAENASAVPKVGEHAEDRVIGALASELASANADHDTRSPPEQSKPGLRRRGSHANRSLVSLGIGVAVASIIMLLMGLDGGPFFGASAIFAALALMIIYIGSSER